MLDRRQFVSLAALLAAGNLTAETQRPQRMEKFRLCDGACCKLSPLRPTADGRDCQFRDPNGKHDVNSSCRIMEDARLIEKLTEAEARRFILACIGYPQVYPPGSFGNCCWRFRD